MPATTPLPYIPPTSYICGTAFLARSRPRPRARFLRVQQTLSKKRLLSVYCRFRFPLNPFSGSEPDRTSNNQTPSLFILFITAYVISQQSQIITKQTRVQFLTLSHDSTPMYFGTMYMGVSVDCFFAVMERLRGVNTAAAQCTPYRPFLIDALLFVRRPPGGPPPVEQVRGLRLGPLCLSEVDVSVYDTAPADLGKRGVRLSIRGGVAVSLGFSVEKSGAINPFTTGRWGASLALPRRLATTSLSLSLSLSTPPTTVGDTKPRFFACKPRFFADIFMLCRRV